MQHIKIPLHKKQREIFSLLNKHKYVVFAKGRRFGFTHGAILYVIASILGGKYKKVLWGDTIHANITRYIKRYALPLLNKLPTESWKWNKNENVIEFYLNSDIAYIDFRSADRPENWEGFGYDLIVLNEAGIILKNRYLWENAVQPMMLDNKHSKALIGGAPKGKNLFYELFRKGETDKSGRWIAKRYTSYDNPLLDSQEIKELENSLPPEAVEQEIYAKFIDSGYFVVVKHIPKKQPPQYYSKVIIGVDPAHEGGDPAGIVILHDDTVVEAKEIKASKKEELLNAVMSIVAPYIPTGKEILLSIERDGIGQGVYEDLIEKLQDLPNVLVSGVKIGSSKNIKPVYRNKKAQLWFKMRELTEKKKLFVSPGVNSKLLDQIGRITYEVKEDGKLQILRKEDYRKEYGGSPNLADALAVAVNLL